jgi:cobalt transporter subunit CbtB
MFYNVPSKSGYIFWGVNKMEIVRELENSKGLLLAVLVVTMACAMVVIAYGVDPVAPGVHDAFHDFRHTLGMPCH